MTLPRYKKVIAAIAVAGGIAALLVRGCVERGGKNDSEEHAQAPRVAVRDGMSIITIDRAAMAGSGIVGAPLLPGTHREARRFYGRVLEPGMFRSLGDNYGSARKQVEAAHCAVSSSRMKYEQIKTLHAARGHTADRDLKSSEGRLRSDEAFEGAAERRLRGVERAARAQWGDGMVNWICGDPRRLDGLIDEKERIVQVMVPAAETSSPPQGPARIRTLDGDSVAAELISTAPRAEAERDGASYFYLIPSGSSGMIPGMMLPVDLSAGPEIRGVAIPMSAVVWYEGKAWAYVQKDAEHLVRREVCTALPLDAGWFMAEGFSPGELVVVNGAQLLLSDEFLSQYQIIEIAE